MSIVIRGLNKPRDCRECPVRVYHAETGKTWCIPQDKLLADNFEPIPFDGRDKGCTISELPEKHGPLIDANELLDKIWDADTRVGYVQVVDRQDIEDAQPLIEAEGE